MKIVYTEEEASKLLLDAAKGLAPEGTVPKLKISRYSSDYMTVEFVEPTTDEDKGNIEQADL